MIGRMRVITWNVAGRVRRQPEQAAAIAAIGARRGGSAGGDGAERALVHDLRQNGWTDAYRALHGYGDRSASWTFANDRGG